MNSKQRSGTSLTPVMSQVINSMKTQEININFGDNRRDIDC